MDWIWARCIYMNVENVPYLRYAASFSLFVYNTLDNSERLFHLWCCFRCSCISLNSQPGEKSPDQSKPFTEGGEMCYGYVSGYEIVSSCLTFFSCCESYSWSEDGGRINGRAFHSQKRCLTNSIRITCPEWIIMAVMMHSTTSGMLGIDPPISLLNHSKYINAILFPCTLSAVI